MRAFRSESPYISGSIIDGAVGLVVVDTGSVVNAMTISFFSEGAHHPATLWVSISPTAYTHALITQAGRFSLAVLHQGQRKIALDCGTVSGRQRDKCSALGLHRSPTGFPFLTDALASTACRVRETIPIGEHTMFVADILEAEFDSRRYRRHLLVDDLVARRR
jgi:flavin reductase (DIM6/NTAB) family NADH-FMN oxidoreductase RutF